jgi:hypothetical protein
MMKRILIAALLVFLLHPRMTQAQAPSDTMAPKPDCPVRYDISASAGPVSYMGLSILILRAFFEGLAESLNGAPHRIDILGTYSIQAYHQTRPWMQLGGKCVYEGTRDIVFQDKEKTMEDYRFYVSCLSVMPSIRFTYLHKPMVRLYSGLDAGVCLIWENNPKSENPYNTLIPAFNLTPLGLQVGKTWYGMLEVNFWSDAIVKAGVGYRFN